LAGCQVSWCPLLPSEVLARIRLEPQNDLAHSARSRRQDSPGRFLGDQTMSGLVARSLCNRGKPQLDKTGAIYALCDSGQLLDGAV
jgi:hypothetical protein